MAINIEVSDTVGFKVKGSINDAAGVAQPFEFGLKCRRLDSEQIQEKLTSESESSLVDFLTDVVEDWSAVRSADGKAIEYSELELKRLCRIPGVAGIAFKAYLSEVGAKEKN